MPRPSTVGNGPSAAERSGRARSGWSAATTGRLYPDRPRRRTWCRGRSAVGGEPTAVAAGDEGVWVAGGVDGQRRRASTPTVRARSSGSEDGKQSRRPWRWPTASLWTAAATFSRPAHRGGQVAATCCRAGPKESRCRSTGYHPKAYTGSAHVPDQSRSPTTASSPTGASQGAAGATLVGALAANVAGAGAPTAGATSSRCGPGCATRTGGPSSPEDFRASIERFLRVTRDIWPSRRFYSGILGAPALRRPGRPTATSRAESRAIPAREPSPIHLRRPDNAFLHRLTLPFASRRARRQPQPRVSTGGGCLPARGRIGSRRGVQIVVGRPRIRNPRFRTRPGRS